MYKSYYKRENECQFKPVANCKAAIAPEKIVSRKIKRNEKLPFFLVAFV